MREKNDSCHISYTEFSTYIQEIVKLHKFEQALCKLCIGLNDGFTSICLPPIIDLSIKLLTKLSGDSQNWIEYWVYELDCGEIERVNESVQYMDGSFIQMRTIEDLWNVINMEVYR